MAKSKNIIFFVKFILQSPFSKTIRLKGEILILGDFRITPWANTSFFIYYLALIISLLIFSPPAQKGKLLVGQPQEIPFNRTRGGKYIKYRLSRVFHRR
jgi:hypothetical protein